MGGGVGECDLGIFEGVGSICDTIMDVAIYICVSNEAMNDSGSTHVITISNTKIINLCKIDLQIIDDHDSILLLFITFINDYFTSIILFKSLISRLSWSF